MRDDELFILAQKISNGEATEEEIGLYNTIMNKLISDDLKQNQFTNSDDIKSELFSRIEQQISEQKSSRRSNTVYLAVSIAATMLIIFSISLLFYKSTDHDVHDRPVQLVEDIEPGGNKAVLTLADGSRIVLDSLVHGEFVSHDGVKIIKKADGELEYTISEEPNANKHGFNTIETPIGGKYKIILPDGTKVWLNSASSIKYPVAFNQSERKVELVGEAYFEVAQLKDSKKKSIPFIVENNRQRIEVLGTHFNVNGYADNEAPKTTLLEGSVRVSYTGVEQARLLSPGQQAIIRNGKISVVAADIESDVAWKNGDFVFNQENLQSVMKKIARWYDVEISYQGANQESKFSGVVSRSKNLSVVLEMMELTGEVKFKIDGRRVFVMD